MCTLCTQRSMEGRSGLSDGLSSQHTGLYACRGQLISTEKLETTVSDPCRRAHLNHCLVERPRMCWLGQHKEHSAAAAAEAGRPRGVAARIVTGPHEAHRQDPHLPMRYDTGRPRAVIRLRISQPRTTSLPAKLTPGAKAIADDGLVSEERVLHPALTMVPRCLLSSTPSERLHPRDRPIPCGRRCLCWSLLIRRAVTLGR